MNGLDRGVITDWIMEEMGRGEFLVTDISPEDKSLPGSFGWVGEMGQEGATFNPYFILIPQTATNNFSPSGFAGDIDYRLPYTVTAFGVSRRQVEDIADDLRSFITGSRSTELFMKDGVTRWTITFIDISTIGGVGYNGQVDPPMYSQTDNYLVTVSLRI